MNVITRFPPSPTGNLHIGGARTALFNYLFAKHSGGTFYLRLEDTDRERSKPEYERNILDSLAWLGLASDFVSAGKPFWRQSERGEVYRVHLKKLTDSGLAYISKESAGERSEVIRFKNPNKKIVFDDLVRGTIEFDTTELGDFVIAKSLEEPLYHLAVVVDDAETGVTHVIRGEDHISNTPRQILLIEALSFTRPVYAHIPLILAPDRSKLSKRHGAVSVTEYRDRGYLPEALLNYLALLGWNPATEQELFTLDELVKVFNIENVQKGGAIFNEEKLRWFNKEYLKKGGISALLPHLPHELVQGRNAVQVESIGEMLLDRVSTYGDITDDFTRGEFDYLQKQPVYEKGLLCWRKATEAPGAHLTRLRELLGDIPANTFAKDALRQALMPYAEEHGKGNVLWPLRVALSGREHSPDPFTLSVCLGKGETLGRIKKALDMLQ